MGTRAYTSDFSPFFGEVLELEGVFVASGLGSSGLTTGPLIGKNLVDLAMNRPGSLDSSDIQCLSTLRKKTNSIKTLQYIEIYESVSYFSLLRDAS
mgnify:CR=1 FL=1